MLKKLDVGWVHRRPDAHMVDRIAGISQHLLLVCITLLATLSPLPAAAYLLGNTLKPFVSINENYDSNVFRVRDASQLKVLLGDDHLSDFISVTSVGADVNYQVSRQSLKFLMRKDFIRFSHYKGQNTDRDEVTGSLVLSLLDKVKINVDGSYVNTPQSKVDFRGAEISTITSTGEGVTVEYRMTSGIGVAAGFHRKDTGYSLQQLRSNEYALNEYTAKISYLVSPKLQTYAAYQHDDRDFEGPASSDYFSDSVVVGVDKALGEATAVSCYAGYMDRRHKGNAGRDYSGLTGKLAATYNVTAKLRLMLSWDRQLYEEVYSDRIYSLNDSLGSAVVYQMTGKIKGTLTGRLSWKDFKDAPGANLHKRSDFIKEMGAGIEWTPLSKLSVNLGYNYSARSSEDSAFDFKDHSVSTGISYKF